MNLADCGDVVNRLEAMAVFQIPSFKSLYARIRKGEFPPPAMQRPARWMKPDLEAWRDGRRGVSTFKQQRRTA